jgi:hypothetical protein
VNRWKMEREREMLILQWCIVKLVEREIERLYDYTRGRAGTDPVAWLDEMPQTSLSRYFIQKCAAFPPIQDQSERFYQVRYGLLLCYCTPLRYARSPLPTRTHIHLAPRQAASRRLRRTGCVGSAVGG